jgi:hypothetical protein
MRHGMRFLIPGVLLLMPGCASLNSDLQTAESKCAQTATMTPFIACLNSVETPVWQKDSPQDVPAYQDFAAARLRLAEDLDSGKIAAPQFAQGTAAARTKLVSVMAETIRARQQQLARQHMDDEMGDLQKSPLPPLQGDMGGMGGMGNNMGM